MGAFELTSRVEQAINSILPDNREWLPNLITGAQIVLICLILICAIKLMIALIQGLRLYVLAQLQCRQPNFKDRYGEWAVVTGAAHGLGLSFAKELARRGMSLVLIDIANLDDTKKLIEAIPNVGKVETLQIDLADSRSENFEKIRQQLQPDSRNIDILINNAGMYPLGFQKFDAFPMSYLLKLSNLNMLHPLHMMRMTLPGMIERRRGMVINVSSISTFMNLPYMGGYSPSKTYVAELTRQLQAEYASEPIDLVLLTPGPIAVFEFEKSKFCMRLFSVTPDEYARTSINAASTGCKEYSGTLKHGLTSHFAMLLKSTGLIPWMMRLTLDVETGSARNMLDPKKLTKRDSDYYYQRIKLDYPES